VNLLELTQALHRATGAGSAAPTTFASVTGERLRLFHWIIEADYKIASMYANWKFLRRALTQSNELVTGEPALPRPSTVKTWDQNTFQLLPVGQTQRQQLECVEWEDVKHEVLTTTVGIPSRVVIMPDGSLRFDPPPNDTHTFFADYYVRPTRLSADASVPAIPEEYHYSCIVAEAMTYYATFENAPEVLAQARMLLDGNPVLGTIGGMASLESDQLPGHFNARTRIGADIQVVAE
jgi:hypothetical protein